MNKPLVTVICLCYNHSAFIRASIQSVLDQHYPNVELIIVDDASTDGSQDIILQLVASHPGIKYFPLSRNLGNCKAFNKGLKHAKGDFIIDLAADDILNVSRISEGVKEFEAQNSSYGVNFTDADIIDEHGEFIDFFYKRKNDKIFPRVAEGDVFADLLQRYFICPPTLMFRREVYDTLDGYNEKLAYEDFDFLIRASKKFKFCFTDQQLVKRRIVSTSLSHQQYRKDSPQLISTFVILRDARKLIENKKEKRAWQRRIIYEGRKSLQLKDFSLFLKYVILLIKLRK